MDLSNVTDNSPSDRYARQMKFAAIGAPGQQRISAARVAIVGCGALGTVAAELLARAGVGYLRLIDRDVVEWTNLQRQALYDEQDASEGNAKAGAACRHLARINSAIRLDPIVADVTSGNIRAVIGEVDLVIDAADNFALRFLLNDWALATHTPWVHGGCLGASGQVRLFRGDGAPCFRCLVPQPPPASLVDTCDTAGVIGPATHAIASLQAAEALKWLSGNRAAVNDRILSVDLWENRYRGLSLSDQLGGNCPACRQADYEFLEGRRGLQSESATALCGRVAVQIPAGHGGPIELSAMAAKWAGIGRVQETPFFVRLYPTEEYSVTLFRDGRVVVTGTDDIAEARTISDRFVGS